MTEEWLDDTNSLEESEEKQSWWAEERTLGSLDTWEQEEKEEVTERRKTQNHHIYDFTSFL